MAHLTALCEICQKIFEYYTSKSQGRFCSKSCAGKAKWKVNPVPVRYGAANSSWRGDAVGYGALHRWVRRQLGQPSFCESCGSTSAKRFEWANVSGEYKRELDDWTRLCKSCHIRMDMTDSWGKAHAISGMKGAIARWGV